MHNNLFNQPLAIDQDYLVSIISDFLISSKTENFLSAKEIDTAAEDSINFQAASAQSNGADRFPVVLDIIGPIIKYSSWYYLGTQSMIRIIQRVVAREDVSGILLNIDSGGGMVSGTAELCSVIKKCSLPTVAFTNGYMCSAAYDIAAACDARMAHPNADLIGSIGTMLSYQDFSAMLEKWGATIYDIYAPQSSLKNEAYRDLKAGKKKKYEERLSYLADDFINRVKSNLEDKLTDDGKVFKGKTYTPAEAKKIGLIDEIGTMREALLKF